MVNNQNSACMTIAVVGILRISPVTPSIFFSFFCAFCFLRFSPPDWYVMMGLVMEVLYIHLVILVFISHDLPIMFRLVHSDILTLSITCQNFKHVRHLFVAENDINSFVNDVQIFLFYHLTVNSLLPIDFVILLIKFCIGRVWWIFLMVGTHINNCARNYAPHI